MQLPQAYRSLPRPSSPLDAKASTVCLIAFDLKIYLLLNHIIQKKEQSVLGILTYGPRDEVHHSIQQLSKSKDKYDRVRPEVRATEGLSPDGPKAVAYSSLQKGGDPAAGSPTATLLRLRPSHRTCLRPLPPVRVGARTSGTPGFHGVTGGVYKARERIHHGVADPRLLAIPASCSRVADCNPNLDRLFAISALSRVGDALYRPL